MLTNARKDHSIPLLLILFVLICRYAATGSCNIFVFIVTWVLLDTSESSTSSDKLGSADASAFMVSKLCSLLYPDTKCCEWIWSRGAFLLAWERGCCLGSSRHLLALRLRDEPKERLWSKLLRKEMMMLIHRKRSLPNKAVRIVKLVLLWKGVAFQHEYMSERWPCDLHTSLDTTMLLVLTNSIHSSVVMAIRPRPHLSGYFWIRNFFFPDTASVLTHPLNPDIFESALQSGK